MVDFVATGGYALKRYDRYATPAQDARRALAHRPSAASPSNTGSMPASSSKSRCSTSACSRKGRPTGAGGRVLGQMEEYFLEQLAPGDTFVFAGDVLRFEGIRDNAAFVTKTHDPEAQVPSYMGGKFPLSTFLAMRVREMMSNPRAWKRLPHPVQEWLRIQQWRSVIPQPGQLLVETFPRGTKHYLVCYPFEGRLAHQTLGMLLTRRLERLRMRPLGFVANEYALAVWGLRAMAASTWTRCSTRTCWATISMPGWRNPRSTSAPSAIARSSPG